MVPKIYEQDKSLGSWVRNQRRCYKVDVMKQDRKDLLDELGFVWTVDDYYHSQWKEQYEKMVEFEQKHGNCLVPHNKENASLGKWVCNQRVIYASNKMRPDRIELLNKLKFVWICGEFGLRGSLWNKQYERLVEFKQKTGHCLVPKSYEQDKSLGFWVRNQRNCYKNDVMKQDRKDLLDELGFVWEVDCGDYYHNQWKEQYEKMVEFEQKHGNCLVPHNKENASLGKWVCNQRVIYASNKMPPDQKELLDKLKFVWNCDEFGFRERLWNEQYERLVEFKQKTGHCLVSKRNKEDVSLANWVSRQRTNKKMRTHRKKLLDNLDFDWKADSLATRSSTTNVRVLLVIGSSHAWAGHVSHPRSFLLNSYRIRIRERSPTH
jgi:hypothetical protein